MAILKLSRLIDAKALSKLINTLPYKHKLDLSGLLRLEPVGFKNEFGCTVSIL